MLSAVNPIPRLQAWTIWLTSRREVSQNFLPEASPFADFSYFAASGELTLDGWQIFAALNFNEEVHFNRRHGL